MGRVEGAVLVLCAGTGQLPAASVRGQRALVGSLDWPLFAAKASKRRPNKRVEGAACCTPGFGLRDSTATPCNQLQVKWTTLISDFEHPSRVSPPSAPANRVSGHQPGPLRDHSIRTDLPFWTFGFLTLHASGMTTTENRNSEQTSRL